ncbi:TonB-dependent siderophore receptor [Tardiphaga sp. OK245]|uniref:TonB-dependent receptor n=1 Tax=Tardiphaga sp. OK245 TaxID=1855306 RepID=UPI001FCD4824|nr:TonB-dependent siderophore receptor [Tardiphaga sp. OK245]
MAAAIAFALLLDADATVVAQTSQALPAVEVHAPTPRAVRRVAPRRNAAVTPRATPRPVERRTPATPATGMIGSLPPAYAGGQVASGAQVGLLGNRGVMDTPFNQTSYTAKTIQDQQARKLDDVFANDPSVTVTVPRLSGFDRVNIRGFSVGSEGYGINGLYGIASSFSLASLGAFERVEVLKGPAALLNGMPPSGGGVGGSVNLVTKRAGEVPFAQLTNTYSSISNFGTHLDVGQRFGEFKEFGVRFNGTYKGGSTELAYQSQEVGSAFLGLDYRGENVRLSADIGYEHNRVTAMTRFVDIAGLPSVPAAPDARANYMPSWGFWDSESRYAIVQGEVDITDNLTAYAQAGVGTSNTRYLYSDIRVTSLDGEFNGLSRRNNQRHERTAAQVGLRANVDTGPINHAINVNAGASEADVALINVSGATNFFSNLYNPRSGPVSIRDVGAPRTTSLFDLTSVGIADTMSVWNGRIQLTAGVRHQYVESESFAMGTGVRSGGYESSATTPAYALVIKPLENVSVYANYIEALEAGTVVGAGYANTGAVLPPYRTTQHEMGVKVDWGRITTTVSAFDIMKPIQRVERSGTLPVLTQSGESRNRGVEINTFGEVTDGVRLLGGVMFIDARQQKTENATYDGKHTFNVPDTQFTLGGEWDVPFVSGLTLTGRALYTGSYWSDQANTVYGPSWTRYDAGARYTFASPWNAKPIVVRFSVENLLDTNYWQASTNDGYIILAAPRTYMVSTTFNF